MIFQKLRDRFDAARFYTLHLRNPAAIEAWQNGALRKLAIYANRNVPMWTEKFKMLQPDPASLSLKDLAKLPILRKDDFTGRMFEEYIDNSRPIAVELHATSGSTGKPFEFFTSSKVLDRYYNNFGRFRFLTWQGWPMEKLLTLHVARIKVTPESGPNRLFISVTEFMQSPRVSVAQIIDFKPYIIETSPSLLLLLVQTLSEDQRHLLRPAYAIAYGEMLTASARDFIEERLGCEVYDRYGTEEAHVIAMECGQHDGQHIYPECIVEIVGNDDTPVPNGQKGRVIVTDLLNYNMPFIRYDTGDLGTIEEERCACGLSLPRLRIIGRHTGSLTFGTRVVNRMEFEAVLGHFAGSILQYQIAKTASSKLEVRVIPTASFDAGKTGELERALRFLIGVGVRAKVEVVSKITLMPAGKSQTIVNESGAV
jgi:phenylacetate-CoA ligase